MNQVTIQQHEHHAPANARDVMTAEVASVSADTPVRDIARLLLDKGISAAPVVNETGVPIGIVSEGDLIGRGESDRLARHDWWLAVIGGRQALDERFRARLQADKLTAVDVMSAPLVTVSEDTPVAEIARLFAVHHIKRVPVVRDGRLAGIVSRADLLSVVADTQPDSREAGHARHGFLADLFGEYQLPAHETVAGNMPPAASARREPARLDADAFRHLADDFHHSESQHADDARRFAARERNDRARQLIDAHVFGEGWRQMMQHAREAAESGQTEVMLLQFPSQLCIDGGRAINVAEPGWPATLRGRAAEIYLWWERELKPRGFTLSARVVEYPDGKPGDVGLFVAWAT